MYEEPQLPSMLGSFTRFNVHAEFFTGRGWTCTLRHRHATDAYNCPHVLEFAHLTMEELAQVFDDFLAAGAHTFTWDSENNRCRSDRSR